MLSKLTKRLVESLESKAQPYEVRDADIKGFLVRVERTGTKGFYYRYPFAGRRSCRYKLGSFGNVSVDGARALALVAAGDVAKGVDPQARKSALRHTVARERLSTLRIYLDQQYEHFALLHLKSGKDQLARIRSDFAVYLDKPMASLNGVVVGTLRQKWHGSGKKPVTINRDLQRLQGVLSRAVADGVLAVHPMKGLKPMKYNKVGRVRFLSAEEEAALRAALIAREDRMTKERASFNEWRVERQREPLPEREGSMLDHLRPMVLVALNTGMRRGELFSLRWSAVDLNANILTVHAESAKSGQTRRIPLNTEAVAVLEAWRQQASGTGLVFEGRGGARLNNVNKSWGGVVKLAKLKGFNFHDLRHTFASKLVQRGVDLNTVRTLLGHSDIKTTLIYAHLAPDNLRAAVAGLVTP